jgi:hypothetical protein
MCEFKDWVARLFHRATRNVGFVILVALLACCVLRRYLCSPECAQRHVRGLHLSMSDRRTELLC